MKNVAALLEGLIEVVNETHMMLNRIWIFLVEIKVGNRLSYHLLHQLVRWMFDPSKTRNPIFSITLPKQIITRTGESSCLLKFEQTMH